MPIICYLCNRPLKLSPKSFEERVACEIRPHGERKTRYYCVTCWENELKLSHNKRRFEDEKTISGL